MVSPLISLIEDQTRYLNELVPGSAAMLSAGMDKRETANVYRRMRGEAVEGDPPTARGLVMVLVTPEKVYMARQEGHSARHIALYCTVLFFIGCKAQPSITI